MTLPQAKKHRKHPPPARPQGTRPQEPRDASLLASGLQNCEIIHVCCGGPPSYSTSSSRNRRIVHESLLEPVSRAGLPTLWTQHYPPTRTFSSSPSREGGDELVWEMPENGQLRSGSLY